MATDALAYHKRRANEIRMQLACKPDIQDSGFADDASCNHKIHQAAGHDNDLAHCLVLDVELDFFILERDVFYGVIISIRRYIDF